MELKKIMAFDLDGTLTQSKLPMTEEMALLLSALSLKTKVAVISGGSYHQFERQLIKGVRATDTEKNLENFILLPASGSSRFEYNPDTRNWNEVYTHPFNQKIKNRVIDELNNILKEKTFDIPEKHYGPYIEDRGNQITLSVLGQEAPLEEKNKWDPSNTKRMKIKEALEKAIPEIDADIAGTTSIDVLPKGFNKAVGLKLLLEDKGLSISDILFIGDAVFEGGNDYSPIQAGIETIGIKGPSETAEIIKKFL